MPESRYPSLAEIRASHGHKVGYERFLFASRYIFRPPSFPAIWVLVRAGLTSEGASWLSGAVALCAYACLLWPGEPQLWTGVALLMLFNFMDCLDGGIARIMGTRNPYGRFLDSVMSWADMIFWAVIGILVWRLPEVRAAWDPFSDQPAAWGFIGVACAFAANYAAYLDDIFDAALRGPWEKLMGESGVSPSPTPLEGKGGVEVAARVLVHNLRVRETHYILLALACAFGGAGIMLACMSIFYGLLFPALLVFYCRRGRKVREYALRGMRAG